MGQQDKVVITTQVDLDKNWNEVSAYNSLPSSVKSQDKQKLILKAAESTWVQDTRAQMKASFGKSKVLSVRTAFDGKPKMLNKKGSSPLFPPSEKALKKAQTLKA